MNFSSTILPFLTETTTQSLEELIVAKISWLHSNVFVPILFVVAVFAAIGNSLVLYVMVKNKGFRQVYSNWLLIFLAFADCIYAYSIIYIIIHKNWTNKANNWNHFLCILESSTKFFGLFYGNVIICFMAFDRFLAINFPIYYRSLGVKARAIATFLITLIWDAITMYLLFYGVDINERVAFCTGGTSTSGVFGYYFSVVSVVIGFVVVALYILIVYGIHRVKKNGDRKSMTETEKAVFKRTSTIIITYMIFWCIPALINFVVTVFLDDEILHTPSEVLVTVGSGLNSLANVITYLVKSPELRRMVVKILPKRLRGESTNRVFAISQSYATKSNRSSVVNHV